MTNINIANILQSQVSNSPWEYLIVDNFLPADLYTKITNEFIKFVENTNKSEKPLDNNGLWPFELVENGFSVDIMQDIMDVNKQLLKCAPKVINKFDYKNPSSVGYFSVPRLGFCPANAHGELHDDGDSRDKSIIMVVYLYPNESLGTMLYTGNTEGDYTKTIKWKTNRSFLFVPQKDVTWHNFKTDNAPRFTINFYYERIEDMSYVTNLSDKKIEWFYNEYTNNSIIEFLNEG